MVLKLSESKVRRCAGGNRPRTGGSTRHWLFTRAIPCRAGPNRAASARAGSRGVIKAVVHQQARGNSGARAPGYDTVVYGAGSMPASSLPLALPPCISSPLVGG